MQFASVFVLAAAALPALAAAAAPVCTASSRSALTPVVELYTSEGCDSCPPADRWFSALKSAAAKGTIVPLAFHVDYWDYLGWKDRFADPSFSARHREAAARGGAKVIYTPQVLFDGREFAQWRRTDVGKLGNGPARPARADLALTTAAHPGEGRQLQVQVAGQARAGTKGAAAYVALYESGLASDVKAGENNGVRLAHDFVVRRWLGPFPFDGAGTLSLTQIIALPADAVPAQSGLAVIAVDERGSLLQSLAVPTAGCPG